MKVGLSLALSHTDDWDRFLATERGHKAPSRLAREDITLGLDAEPLGFDSIFLEQR